MRNVPLASALGILLFFNVAKAQSASESPPAFQLSVALILPNDSAQLFLNGEQGRILFRNHFSDPWDLEYVGLFKQGLGWFLAGKGTQNGSDQIIVLELKRKWDKLFVPQHPDIEICRPSDHHFCCYCNLPFPKTSEFCCYHP